MKPLIAVTIKLTIAIIVTMTFVTVVASVYHLHPISQLER